MLSLQTRYFNAPGRITLINFLHVSHTIHSYPMYWLAGDIKVKTVIDKDTWRSTSVDILPFCSLWVERECVSVVMCWRVVGEGGGGKRVGALFYLGSLLPKGNNCRQVSRGHCLSWGEHWKISLPLTRPTETWSRSLLWRPRSGYFLDLSVV